nr:M28 family peptidase [Legionella jordanis]
MRFFQRTMGLSASLMFVLSPSWASTSPKFEQIQIPLCLATKLPSTYETLAEDKHFKIIEIPSADMNKLAHFADEVHCGRFVNVSHRLSTTQALSKQQAAQHLLAQVKHKSTDYRSPIYEIKHQEEVNAALAQVDSNNIMATLLHLTSYYNRSATKPRGKEVADWLQKSFDNMAQEYQRSDVSSFQVETGWYEQPSVVTVIGKDLKAPGIVIGAHMDTLDGRMPGAGDDGSGSSSVMEMARVLLSSKLNLKRPIYIIWYAAEERGLVGSQYVTEYFQNNSIPVKAAIQFDMTGYRNNPDDQTIWVFRDYTDKALSNYIVDLIQTYVKVPVDYSRCGYGCSDHASWTDIGVPAAFPCETSFEDHNPYIHTEKDKVNLLYPEHMTNFSKLGLAFAIELASE